MSSSVSPCQWRYRGSGSTEPKGLAVSRKAALLRGWKSCDVDSFEPLRLRHLPYPRYRAAEENIATHQPHSLEKYAYPQTHKGERCYAPTAAQTSQRVCQFHRHLNPQL